MAVEHPNHGSNKRPLRQGLATDLLQVGDPLSDEEVEGLVCFLRALTDQRYEPLIDPNGIDRER